IPEIRRIVRTLPDIETISLNHSLIGKAEDGRAELGSAIADRALSLGGWPLDLRTRDEFVALAERAWKHLGQASSELSDPVAQSLELHGSLSQRLNQTFAAALQPSANDMRQQLARLVYPG